MNPLHGITQSLGLSPKVIAKLFNLDGVSVAAALNPDPNNVIQAYIAIENGLMMKRVLRGVPPMRITLDTEYIHGLHKNNEFRAFHRFCPVHDKIRDMQKVIAKYKEGRTVRYVAERLEREYLPTWHGHRHWRGSTVQHFTKKWSIGMYQHTRSEPKEAYYKDWREYVIRDWWLMPCFPDPSWMVRYEMAIDMEGDKIIVSTKKPLPAFVDKHIFTEMDKNRWMKGKWRSE